jgi:hypothetical protein
MMSSGLTVPSLGVRRLVPLLRLSTRPGIADPGIRRLAGLTQLGRLDAMRSERVSTAGPLVSSLLRTAGAWPWTSYGEDPGPLLERLVRLERFVAHDPAAHVRVLAALAAGRCYDPNPAVPDRLSMLALQRAEELGDPDVLADALLGRLITYSGVAAARTHSQAWLEMLGPWVWITHGHVVLLAHVAADMALKDLASSLIELLKPYSGLVATIGHIGNVGPVDLAAGRLHALLGEGETARRLLERARDQAARSGGLPSMARCERALSEL